MYVEEPLTPAIFQALRQALTYNWNNSNTAIGLSAFGSGNVPSFNAVNGTNAPITATITVKPVINGCEGTSSSYTITVNPTPVILLNGSSLTTFNISSSYQWFRNNQPIPGATSQSYIPVQPGDYSIILGGSPCPSNIITNTNAGIEQIDGNYYFTVYPNPTDGNCFITFNTAIKSAYKLELKDALGALVYQETLTNFSGTYSKPIDLSPYGKGIYFVSIYSPEMETIKKVIVY
jgi:hypothetical protein